MPSVSELVQYDRIDSPHGYREEELHSARRLHQPAARGRARTSPRRCLHACPVRLRPILMTSIATVAGAIPEALNFGAGRGDPHPDGDLAHRRRDALDVPHACTSFPASTACSRALSVPKSTTKPKPSNGSSSCACHRKELPLESSGAFNPPSGFRLDADGRDRPLRLHLVHASRHQPASRRRLPGREHLARVPGRHPRSWSKARSSTPSKTPSWRSTASAASPRPRTRRRDRSPSSSK